MISLRMYEGRFWDFQNKRCGECSNYQIPYCADPILKLWKSIYPIPNLRFEGSQPYRLNVD
ncbi:hypothetical protein K450DRAFT_244630 [Umbelopsis ramanniana AG]|uniref:Uncharacterized protein n=1 Tax=Umbelopsis ramanniana AG TaxID=1314678 RepID=A0AAD5E7D8_UMBRA|nr:uncharacterized protein K450DRAFT_244630 [Umbelopsis ramanniana AG]KAI8578818.1 hypothetical protein K450DRAFT_244630 [Umbelopsis ramanniana AG]